MAEKTVPVPAPAAVLDSKIERKRGDGNTYLRGKTWWIRYSHHGKEHCESSHSPDREHAEKLLKRRTREVWNDRMGVQSFVPKAAKVRVSELLDALEADYKLKGGRALAQFRSHAKPIRLEFSERRSVDVSAKHIDDYIHARQEEGRAPATINRELQLLSQSYKLGIQRRQIVNAPHIRRLPERNTRLGFFERGEFEAVVAALPPYLQDFCKFAHLCAWRKGQISSLTWQDVDRENGILQARAEHTKNERPHKLIIDGDLADIIERRWQDRQIQMPDGSVKLSEYVFHRQGLPVGDFSKSWETACKAAGLVKPKLDKKGNPVFEIVDGQRVPVLTHAKIFHDFRRTGVRNMVRAGIREGVAMSVSGHRTRSIFDRYNITSEDDLRQAMKQTSEHVNAQPAERKVVSIGKK